MLKGTLRFVVLGGMALSIATPGFAETKKHNHKKHRGGGTQQAQFLNQADNAAGKALKDTNLSVADAQALLNQLRQTGMWYGGWYNGGYAQQVQDRFDQSVLNALSSEERATGDLLQASRMQEHMDQELVGQGGIIDHLWDKADILNQRMAQLQQQENREDRVVDTRMTQEARQMDMRVNELQSKLDYAIGYVLGFDIGLYADTRSMLAGEQREINQNRMLINEDTRAIVSEQYQIWANDNKIAENGMREMAQQREINNEYWRQIAQQSEINRVSYQQANDMFHQAIFDLMVESKIDRQQQEIHADREMIFRNFELALDDRMHEKKQEGQIKSLTAKEIRDAAEIALNKSEAAKEISKLKKEEILNHLVEKINQKGIEKIDSHLQKVESDAKALLANANALANNDMNVQQELTDQLNAALLKLKEARADLKAGKKTFANNLLEARKNLMRVSQVLKSKMKTGALSADELVKLHQAHKATLELTGEAQALGQSGGDDARSVAEARTFQQQAIKSQERNLNYLESRVKK